MSEDGTREVAVEDDALAQLLRAAGRRPEPPAAAYEETRQVALSAWKTRVGRRRRQMRLAWAGMAASLVCGLSLLSVIGLDAPPAAAPDRLVGAVYWQASGGSDWTRLSETSRELLPAGSRVRTAEGAYAGLRLVSGASLRLSPGTAIGFAEENEIALEVGAVYVDSAGAARDGDPLTISTPTGRAVEVGTQFEVSYGDRGYRLRVREGLVRLEREAGVIESRAGQEFRIGADGILSERRIAPTDEAWRWVHTVAPVPDIDSRPVTVLLEWVSRETGRPLRYATPELRKRAAGTILHGNIQALSPLEALETMLATTDLDYAILGDGTIEVRTRTRP